MRRWFRLALTVTALIALTSAAGTQRVFAQAPPSAFPADGAFNAVTCVDPTAVPSQDSCSDSARDHRNVVGGGNMPAYQLTNDGTYLYMRLRLEGDPRQSGALVAFAWGFGIDVDGDGAFESYVSVIGQGNDDRVEIYDQDSSNGVTPNRVKPGGAGADTSLRPVVTDGSQNSWVQVTSAGSRFCNDSVAGSDFFLTAAVPLSVLADFGALGGSVAYGGSSSNFTGIQSDFVCIDGAPTACTMGSQCPSGVCLTGTGVCGPGIPPIPLGCLDTSLDNTAIDSGCSTTSRHCLVANNTSVCVPCISDGHCVDANECTINTCASNACTFPASAVGSTCSIGVCDSNVTCATVAVSIDSPSDGAVLTSTTPTVSGTATPGLVVSVSVDGDVIGTVNAAANGAWSLPVSSPLTQGSHSLSASVTTGNGAAMDLVTVTIDTLTAVAFTFPAAFELIADPTPTLMGSGEAGATVSVTVDGNPIGSVVVANNGTWFLTVPLSLSVGSHSAVASAIDTAGNAAVASVAFEIVQCLDNLNCSGATPQCNPSTNTCVACLDGSHCNDNNDCTVDSCGAGACMNSARPEATPCAGGVCSNPGSACVECVNDEQCSGVTPRCDTSTNACVACLNAAHCNDNNDCTSDSCSAGVCANAVRGFGASCAQGICNATNVCAVVFVRIDTPLDNAVTADAMPVISGAATAGTTVTIRVDGSVVGSVVADANSAWTFALTSALAPGTHFVDAEISTSNGAPTDRVTFTVDLSTDVTIASPADGSTILDATPTIRGTGEPGAEIVVLVNSIEVGRVNVALDGTWQVITTTALANGPHTVAATATDAAGNTDMANAAFTVAVSTQVAILAPVDGDAVADDAPTVVGTAVPGATIDVTLSDGVDTTVIGQVIADGNGDWSIAINQVLADGTYTVVARATVGSASAEDSSTFRVDTSTSVTIDLVDPRLGRVAGTGEPGATVVLEIDGTVVGNAVVGSDGNWVVSIVPLTDGDYELVATATDTLGNTGSVSVTVSVETQDASADNDAGATDAGLTDGGVLADAGAAIDAAIDSGAASDGGAGVDGGMGGAGGDAAVMGTDSGTDGAVMTDAGMQVSDSGMNPGDSGMSLSDSGMNMGDGAISSDAGSKTKGRYSGGALCSVSAGASGSRVALGLFLLTTLVALRRRRRAN